MPLQMIINNCFRFFYKPVLCLIVLLVLASNSQAQYLNVTPDELLEVGVDEKTGEFISGDILLFDADGDTLTISDLLYKGKPLILNLVYYECPMLCSLVMNGILKSLQGINWTPGKEFNVLTVSIDPEETPKIASTYKSAYYDSLNIINNGWYFTVSNESNIQKLSGQVGFKFKYDAEIEQYAHPAVIVFIDDQGMIIRYLYGIEFASIQLKKALDDASKGIIGNTIDRILLYCYQYNPESKSYVPVAINIMKVSGFLVMIALGIFLGLLWYREKQLKSTL